MRNDLVGKEASINYAIAPNDDVNNPKHYTNGNIEVIDYTEDQALNYHLGNVVKYICRHELKGTPIKDLKKAQWYLNRYISKLEAKDK